MPARARVATCSCSAMVVRSHRRTMRSMSSSASKDIDGFYGASSMERLPTELAIAQQVRDFVGLNLGGRQTGA